MAVRAGGGLASAGERARTWSKGGRGAGRGGSAELEQKGGQARRQGRWGCGLRRQARAGTSSVDRRPAWPSSKMLAGAQRLWDFSWRARRWRSAKADDSDWLVRPSPRPARLSISSLSRCRSDLARQRAILEALALLTTCRPPSTTHKDVATRCRSRSRCLRPWPHPSPARGIRAYRGHARVSLAALACRKTGVDRRPN